MLSFHKVDNIFLTLFLHFLSFCNMRLLLILVSVFFSIRGHAQFLIKMADSSQLTIGGYSQLQYQAASKEGAQNYSGGDFATHSKSRFMLRRSRIKFEYLKKYKNETPLLQFVFQIGVTDRGGYIRDARVKYFENKYDLFSLTAGLFPRPFGNEVLLSSSKRETPERGRMSQILMKSERDMGAMISFEPQNKDNPLRYLKIDAGLFNGSGLTFPDDYDSHKDFIGRIALKPYPLFSNVSFSMGTSYLNGGILQTTPFIYSIKNSGHFFTFDSSQANIGKIAPRKYYGVDAQLKIKGKAGITQLRGEIITGTQTAFAESSQTPDTLPDANGSLYIRNFRGAYFYLLQNIVNEKNLLVIKYDWYDPNTFVSSNEIGKPGSNLTIGDIRYATLGFGFLRYLTNNVKMELWYDRVWNEKTNLPGYTHDLADNIFTCRLQIEF